MPTDRETMYKLVYQSGHGDVYCNGKQHVGIQGDCWGEAPLSTNKEAHIHGISIYPCDCEYWSTGDWSPQTIHSLQTIHSPLRCKYCGTILTYDERSGWWYRKGTEDPKGVWDYSCPERPESICEPDFPKTKEL